MKSYFFYGTRTCNIVRESCGFSQVKVLLAQEEKSEIETRSILLKMVFLIVAEETDWNLLQAETVFHKFKLGLDSEMVSASSLAQSCVSEPKSSTPRPKLWDIKISNSAAVTKVLFLNVM